MNFDIARAWKDEEYRQALSEEQQSQLPAHPAGELDEAELATVTGGEGWFPGFVGTSTSAAATSVKRIHSFAVLCDLSVFSLNIINVTLIPIASPLTQVCAESH